MYDENIVPMERLLQSEREKVELPKGFRRD
jgi:hypothetical protein